MSAELLVLYSEKAEARLMAERDARFGDMVSAVRIGQSNAKWFRRWLINWQRQTSRESVGLTGAALEAKVMSLAATNPEYVVVEHG